MWQFSVEYDGYAPDLDQVVRRTSRAAGGPPAGSGFDFGSKVRDFFFEFEDEQKAKAVAAALKAADSRLQVGDPVFCEGE